MDLIALAVPFFLLALLIEVAVDRWRGTGLYRLNDAINSLSAGTLNQTTGYFTRFLSILLWGLVLEHLAVFTIPASWFELSATGLLWWLLAILAWDFCYYWNHRLGHEVSILWAAHAVHHQSEDYNLSTALRQTSSGFLFSWIFYVPLFVLGFPLEVLVTANAINLIYQFWVHTQTIGRLGVLDRILVTPSNHRVHHAQNERYIDRNYGGILILWDRLFGTFEEERDDDPVVFGVRKPLLSWNPLWANWQVYDYLLFDARHTRRWRDKLGIWFRRTGWRPADVEDRWPRGHRSLSAFRKFDPPLRPGMRAYILFQFLVAVAALFVIATLFARQGAAAVTVPCLWLWGLLLTIGWLSEGRPSGPLVEAGRLLVLTPLIAWLLAHRSEALPWIAAGYAAVSVLALTLAVKSDKKHKVNDDFSISSEVMSDA